MPVGGGFRGAPGGLGWGHHPQSLARSNRSTRRVTATTVTVDVTSSTTYSDPSVTSATPANVTGGEQISVVGTTSSGTVTATKALIGLTTISEVATF